MNTPILTVSGLQKRFNREAGFFAPFGEFVYAVNGVTFELNKTETYALVGESGCGKTTTARLLIRMYEPSVGSIYYHGSDLEGNVCSMNTAQLRQYRESVKYIFQDPAKSLNPRMTVEEILLCGYRYSKKWPGRQQARKEAAQILEETGLSAADMDRRPADFSGGQRQRISIARGLIMRPQVLICDEVISALDVSIQGQILNLLLELRQNRGLSLIFITHDLKVASYFCDRIGVMYHGEIVEEAPAQNLYREALHPYTQLLFASFSPARGELLRGEAASSGSTANGCPFAPRCPKAQTRCTQQRPPVIQKSPEHRVSCFLA